MLSPVLISSVTFLALTINFADLAPGLIDLIIPVSSTIPVNIFGN
jgi:hypothetical protein